MKLYGLKLRDIVALPRQLVLDADPVDARRARAELGLERQFTRKTQKTQKTQKSAFSIGWKVRLSASIRRMRWRRRSGASEYAPGLRRSRSLCSTRSTLSVYSIGGDSFKENVPLVRGQTLANHRAIGFEIEPHAGPSCDRPLPVPRRRPLSEINFETIVAREL